MNTLFAANWKMHKTSAEAADTAGDLVRLSATGLPAGREVLLIPPFTALAATGAALAGHDRFHLGAQNFYPATQGAFTGEISPAMLQDCGAGFALTGHSERRHVLGEDDVFVGRKTAFGLDSGLKIILCVGEKIEERKADQLGEVLTRQIGLGLADVPRDILPERLCVAYEPVWAIGTGLVAGPAEILEAHALVRTLLVGIFGQSAKEMRILYGGSVKPDNAAEIIALDNVNGVLVGGASLKADDFSRIVLPRDTQASREEKALQTLVLTIHILTCVFLVIFVLLQSGQEGMGVIFGGGSGSVFGSTGAGGLLVRITGVLAAIFLVTSLAYNVLTKPSMMSDSTLMTQGAAGMTAPAPAQLPPPGGVSFEEKALPKPLEAPGDKK